MSRGGGGVLVFLSAILVLRQGSGGSRGGSDCLSGSSTAPKRALSGILLDQKPACHGPSKRSHSAGESTEPVPAMVNGAW